MILFFNHHGDKSTAQRWEIEINSYEKMFILITTRISVKTCCLLRLNMSQMKS